MTITEKAIEALQSGMLDTSDIEPYMDAILNALYKEEYKKYIEDKTNERWKGIKNDYVKRRDVMQALVSQGQTKRYEMNKEWELNYNEICAAINKLSGIEDPSSYTQGWDDGRKALINAIQRILIL